MALGEPSTTAKGQRLLGAFDRFWDTLAAHCDADRDGRITPAEYREGMLTTFVDGEHFDPVFLPAAAALVTVADHDEDGTVDRSEFQTLEGVMGIAEADSLAAFEHLDTNGDGVLEIEEYLVAIRDYYTSSDPDAPGNWLYGPAFQLPAVSE